MISDSTVPNPSRRAAPHAASPPIIEMRAVSKWFGRHQVLRDVNLSVGSGEKVVVLGPSGSGESTLIRCINRLEEFQ